MARGPSVSGVGRARLRGVRVVGASQGRSRPGTLHERVGRGVREVVGMSEALLLPPHDAWTLADLDKVPDDGCRYEIFDGSLLGRLRRRFGIRRSRRS